MRLLSPTLFSLLSGAASLVTAARAAEPICPPGWDPVIAGDQVMQRLVRVSAPPVKGAHDAEFVCVGGKAYIVEHDNDVQPGHGAGAAMYCVLTVVDLATLEVGEPHLLAKTGQAYANVTLPEGQTFVPRILQVNDTTLRCYFASKGPEVETTWYRDFDLASETFAPTIHKAKLKTRAGTFDMTPLPFHADAALDGFRRRAKTSGMYLFDSFKRFDGKTYLALNNFPGKQNALAVVHDDGVTVEVIGHYNEPQSDDLSESAVNRLPDGTWMAIIRDDSGNKNYHFATSADGRTWSEAVERPDLVPNGLNSKPTFDRFGGLYYLGWQEATQYGGANRSVFNVDVSRDSVTWERKYRFETDKTFQYPTFHEYEGDLWLTVSQSDHHGSTDRIMFGKLEAQGAFESQAGLTRKPEPVVEEEPAVLEPGVTLYTDRTYRLLECPDALKGHAFLRTTIDDFQARVEKGGTLYALTPPETISGAASQETVLKAYGFEKTDAPVFRLFPGEINQVCVYRKTVAAGETLSFKKVVLLVAGKGVGFGS